MGSKVLVGFVVMLLQLLEGFEGVQAQLSVGFYESRCPGAEALINRITRSHIARDRTLAPSLLRLHFHDCFVQGCDGSVLLDRPPGQGEKDAAGNRGSLRGFEVIDDIKTQIEGSCPGLVSCADILALAARDAIVAFGGTNWSVPVGRRDGLTSLASLADADLPPPTADFDTLRTFFERKGLTSREMVLLSGAHTIGAASCSRIETRLYNFSSARPTDPALDAAFAARLRGQCRFGDRATVIPMDQTKASDAWDRNFYSNVLRGKALFASDNTLKSNPDSLRLVKQLNRPASAFDREFGAAMEKMGRIQILTGSRGQVRRNCRAVNT